MKLEVSITIRQGSSLNPLHATQIFLYPLKEIFKSFFLYSLKISRDKIFSNLKHKLQLHLPITPNYRLKFKFYNRSYLNSVMDSLLGLFHSLSIGVSSNPIPTAKQLMIGRISSYVVLPREF